MSPSAPTADSKTEKPNPIPENQMPPGYPTEPALAAGVPSQPPQGYPAQSIPAVGAPIQPVPTAGGYPSKPPPTHVYPPQPPLAAGVPIQLVNGVVVPVTVTIPVGSDPVTVICGNCHEQVETSTTDECGTAALIMCCICWPFSCCPFVMDVKHQCPNCKAHIGTYKRIG